MVEIKKPRGRPPKPRPEDQEFRDQPRKEPEPGRIYNEDLTGLAGTEPQKTESNPTENPNSPGVGKTASGIRWAMGIPTEPTTPKAPQQDEARFASVESAIRQLRGETTQLQGDLNDMYAMLKRFGEEFRDALKKVVGKESKVEMNLPPTFQNPLSVQCNRCGALMENRHEHAKQWVDGSWYCPKCYALQAK